MAAARPSIRQLHIYLSFFIAPALLFFAITGAFQTFRIPDEKTAPVLLQKLARVHRDDVFALKPAPKTASDQAEPKKAAAPKAKAKPALPTTLVKWFFVLTSIVMVITTLMGVWMGLAYSRKRAALWLLLLAGSAVPMSLLAL